MNYLPEGILLGIIVLSFLILAQVSWANDEKTSSSDIEREVNTLPGDSEGFDAKGEVFSESQEMQQMLEELQVLNEMAQTMESLGDIRAMEAGPIDSVEVGDIIIVPDPPSPDDGGEITVPIEDDFPENEDLNNIDAIDSPFINGK